MKKIIKLFKNVNVKYFTVLTVLCFLLVSAFRPIVQNNINSVAVNAQPEPAKKKLPIYCVNTDEKKVAISFDAAWGADDTDEILTILKNNDVKATFFLCGYWVDKYPEEIKRIYQDGHEIGNHSNTHPHVSQISLDANKKEIMEVHNKIKNLLGYEMNLYRPPFGEYNDTVLKAANEVGYHTIQWDIETLETKIEVL